MSNAYKKWKQTSHRSLSHLIAILIATITFYPLSFSVHAHPMVPSFDRLPNNTIAEQISGGELLINELNCVACHSPNKHQSKRFQSLQAPVLFTTHNTTSAGWLKRWLNDPNKIYLLSSLKVRLFILNTFLPYK